ncbi:MAG: hypothetical protein AAFR12_21545, partial [Cyanobacteria bacterium J06626_6]
MLSEQVKTTFKDAARKLTGAKKRAFTAQVALDYFDGSARRTERALGWDRVMVQRGLDSLKSGSWPSTLRSWSLSWPSCWLCKSSAVE